MEQSASLELQSASEFSAETAASRLRKASTYLRSRLALLEGLRTNWGSRRRRGKSCEFSRYVADRIGVHMRDEITDMKRHSTEMQSISAALAGEDETDACPQFTFHGGEEQKHGRHIIRKGDIVFSKSGIKVRKEYLDMIKSRIHVPERAISPKGETVAHHDTGEEEYRAQRKRWIEENKLDPTSRLFVITGNYPDIRKALLNRGWVENTNTASPFFDLKWALKHRDIDYAHLQDGQVVNHYRNTWGITTKIGLLRVLRILLWTHNVDSETFFPRAYDMSDLSDIRDFVAEFRLSKVPPSQTLLTC